MNKSGDTNNSQHKTERRTVVNSNMLESQDKDPTSPNMEYLTVEEVKQKIFDFINNDATSNDLLCFFQDFQPPWIECWEEDGKICVFSDYKTWAVNQGAWIKGRDGNHERKNCCC